MNTYTTRESPPNVTIVEDFLFSTRSFEKLRCHEKFCFTKRVYLR